MPRHPTFLYVVEAACGLIKIGISRAPETRAAAINLLSPVPCRLIAVWPGTRGDEHEWHRKFDRQRGHAEWFRVEGPIVEFVEVFRGIGVAHVLSFDEVTPTPARREERRAAGRVKQSLALKRAWANPAKRAEWRGALDRGRRAARAEPAPAETGAGA